MSYKSRFPLGFQEKYCTHLVFTINAACSANYSSLHLFTIRILGEEYQLLLTDVHVPILSISFLSYYFFGICRFQVGLRMNAMFSALPSDRDISLTPVQNEKYKFTTEQWHRPYIGTRRYKNLLCSWSLI
jgi:hypothetical protein